MLPHGGIYPHRPWFFASSPTSYLNPSLAAWHRSILNLRACAFHIWAITYRMSGGSVFL
jgi:hypothetical protein